MLLYTFVLCYVKTLLATWTALYIEPVELGIDSGLELGIDSGLELGIDSGLELGIDSGLELGIDSGLHLIY
jgi:hypothetical protein